MSFREQCLNNSMEKNASILKKRAIFLDMVKGLPYKDIEAKHGISEMEQKLIRMNARKHSVDFDDLNKAYKRRPKTFKAVTNAVTSAAIIRKNIPLAVAGGLGYVVGKRGKIKQAGAVRRGVKFLKSLKEPKLYHTSDIDNMGSILQNGVVGTSHAERFGANLEQRSPWNKNKNTISFSPKVPWSGETVGKVMSSGHYGDTAVMTTPSHVSNGKFSVKADREIQAHGINNNSPVKAKARAFIYTPEKDNVYMHQYVRDLKKKGVRTIPTKAVYKSEGLSPKVNNKNMNKLIRTTEAETKTKYHPDNLDKLTKG